MKNLKINYLRFLTAFIFILFFILTLKNPYSHRNLISNLEPFPDTQHYITTPLCFIDRGQWQLCRLYNPEITGINNSVPPLYSLYLLPFLLINNDPRTFYFANLFLAVISLFLFRKLVQKLFGNYLITTILSLLLITNYFFYWLPTLAMAENLFLPLFLFGLTLLLSKTSYKNIFFAGLVTVSFYGTKYAFAPITFTYGITYMGKLLIENWGNKKIVLKKVGMYLLFGLLITPLFFDIQRLFFFTSGLTNTTISGKSGSSTFSLSFFNTHFVEYLKPLLGKTQRFLWDTTPLVPQWLAQLSLFGLAFSFFEKKTRLISFFLVSSTVLQLLFISTFYVVDARYVYNFLPTLLIGFGFALDLIRKKLVFTLPFMKEANHNYTFYIIAFVLLGYYLLPLTPMLKKQVGLNFRYTETPWWKVSVEEYNTFFTEKNNNYLIALHSPYFFDYYSNQNYQPLPLSDQQDFHGNYTKVWGEADYTELIELYRSKMNESNVYVTNYGINATSSFTQAFEEIEKNFTLVQVHDGCHHLCNIYQLQPLEISQSNSAH